MHLYGHACTKSLEAVKELLNNMFIVWTSVIAEKILDDELECTPCVDLIAIKTVFKLCIFE